MNAFTRASAALHGDGNVAVDATFDPEIGASVSLKAADGTGVILSAGDPGQDVFETGYRRSKTGISVPQSALNKKPVDGDRLTVGDREFVIRAADPDAEGVTWNLDVDEQQT